MAAITLTQVNTAITEILTLGQSYQLMDQKYVMADMEMLIKLRTQLQAEARTAGSIIQPVRFTPMT